MGAASGVRLFSGAWRWVSSSVARRPNARWRRWGSSTRVRSAIAAGLAGLCHAGAGGTVTVVMNDGVRYRRPVNAAFGSLSPAGPDGFACQVVTAGLQFGRDASGRVVALPLHQNGEHRAARQGD